MKDKYLMIYWEWLDPDDENEIAEDNFIMSKKYFNTEEDMRQFVIEDNGYMIESVISMIKVEEHLQIKQWFQLIYRRKYYVE